MPLRNRFRATVRPVKHWAEELYLRIRPGHPMLRRRERLPILFNAMGLRGVGAEIGVFKGEFSAYILNRWRGSRLISVDPWIHWSSSIYTDRLNFDQKIMDDLYTSTRQFLSRHGPRSQIWRMTSAEAAGRLEDQSLDFVYIDAQHHDAAVSEDLNLWFPKVRSGGVFTGHDYCDGEFDGVVFGVKTAVDRFCRQRNLTLHVTKERRAPSWYVLK